METNGDINFLLKDCISHIISMTTPRDACVSSLVCSSLRSAADSDIVWESFLPSDYASFLSRAVQPVQYASKKELYLRLCDHPIQIDGGKLSFGVEKSTGAKCFTISACKLNIPKHGAINRKLIPLSDSRFSVAVEFFVDFVEIYELMFKCRIENELLSLHTTYAVFLIFKSSKPISFWPSISNAFINTLSKVSLRVLVSAVLNVTGGNQKDCVLVSPAGKGNQESIDVELCGQRTDGWTEFKVGEFYSENCDRVVEIGMIWEPGRYWESDVVILGVELRPKGV